MAGIGIGLGVGLGGGGGWSETAIARVLAGKGLSDAAARAAVGGAPSLAAGLRAVGLLPPVPAAPSSSPAMTPLPAGLAAMWDAASLSSLADGAPVANWADAVKGIAFAQTIAGNRPTVVADALGGGRRGVRFDGRQFLTAARSGAAADLAALVDSQRHTTYIVATGIGGSGYGCAFGATAGGNSYFALADGSVLGRFDGGTTGQTVPFSGSGPVAFGFSSTTDTSGGSGAGLQRTYVNGGCVAATVFPVPKTSADLGMGALASGALGFVGTILYVFVFDHELTPVEMIQLEKAWRDRAGLAYPWAGGEFLVMLGDSQTMGVGADANSATYPYQLAQRRGLAPGQWSNLGIGGIAVDQPSVPAAGPQMRGRLPKDVYGTGALLGFAPKYVVGEWYNMHGLAGATSAGYMAAYLQSLKTESPSSKVALWTSFTFAGDTAAAPDVNRAAYDAYWNNASNRGRVDAYVPIHADASLGLAGACPASAPYGALFSDGIHLTGKPGYPATQSGYPYFADKLQQALADARY